MGYARILVAMRTRWQRFLCRVAQFMPNVYFPLVAPVPPP
jgi:hypothetical protein